MGRGGVRKSGRQTVGREGNREWGERGRGGVSRRERGWGEGE